MAKVWNATSGTLRVGASRTLLPAGESVDIAIDERTSEMLASGKLVIIESPSVAPTQDTQDTDVATSAKKAPKKKPAQVEVEPVETSEEVVAEEQEISSTIDEQSEDSILPDDNQ